MAQQLNKSRMRNSRRAVWAGALLYLITAPYIPLGSKLHEVNEFIGYFLVILCVFGRIYSTAFIGGHKNDTLIVDGPFAAVRNPLYVCSLIGIVGIGIMSNRITILLALLLMHLISYHFLVAREEKLLEERFGDIFRDYCTRVPRFVPNFASHTLPASIEMRPEFLRNAIRDAWVWLLPYPAFELIDYLHATSVLPTFFMLP